MPSSASGGRPRGASRGSTAIRSRTPRSRSRPIVDRSRARSPSRPRSASRSSRPCGPAGAPSRRSRTRPAGSSSSPRSGPTCSTRSFRRIRASAGCSCRGRESTPSPSMLAKYADSPTPLWTSAKGAYAEPVAEHAVTLMLGLMRMLPEKAGRPAGRPNATASRLRAARRHRRRRRDRGRGHPAARAVRQPDHGGAALARGRAGGGPHRARRPSSTRCCPKPTR